LEVPVEAIEAYTEVLMENNAELAKNKKLAAQTAVENMKFSKQLSKLNDVVKDNIKVIKKADKDSLEYYESLGAVTEMLKETFGTDVSANFVATADNIDLISEAAEGNEKAIKKLGAAIAKDYVENLDMSTDYIDAFSGLEDGEVL
jgi:preprotein translocase subunit SecA